MAFLSRSASVGNKLLVACIALAPAHAHAQQHTPESFTALAQLFSYDNKLPFNARTFERFDTIGFVRDKLVFDGWRGSRVPGLIAIPKTSESRHPIILLVDGIGGWKERWWQRTSWNRGRTLIDSLLAGGFAVAMIDAPASGERIYENDYQSAESFINKPAQWRDMAVQNTIELRRLIDYVSTRADIDTTRIAVVGLSHGGMVSFYLAALEPRVRAAAAGLTPMQRVHELLWPGHYAEHITIPFLMLHGTTDSWYTREQVEAVSKTLASKEKRVIWYDVGHRMPEEYAGDVVRWMRQNAVSVR